MRKIYHLGLHKTGSTSVQRFLLANQIHLARSGWLFPAVTHEALERFEQELKGCFEARPARLNEYMGHNALSYRLMSERLERFRFPEVHEPMISSRDAFGLVHQSIKAFEPHTLFFCSEDLARASLHLPDIPEAFAHEFGKDDVTLFASVRRPDEAIAAWQTQKLRFAKPFSALRDVGLEAYLGTVHLEYRAALEPWVKAFPNARIVFEPYGQMKAQGGSVVALKHLLPELSDLVLVDVPKANSGLPHALLEIARLGLEVLPASSALALRAFLARGGRQLALPANAEVDLIGSNTRAQLFRGFCDTHHWLGQISGKLPFFEDIDEMLVAPPMTEREAAAEALSDIVALAAEALKDEAALEFLASLKI